MPPARKKSKRLHRAAVRAAMPASIEPMLPTLVSKPSRKVAGFTSESGMGGAQLFSYATAKHT